MRSGAGLCAHGAENPAADAEHGRCGDDALQSIHRRHGKGTPCAGAGCAGRRDGPRHRRYVHPEPHAQHGQGPAVHSLRAQADKKLYQRRMLPRLAASGKPDAASGRSRGNYRGKRQRDECHDDHGRDLSLPCGNPWPPASISKAASSSGKRMPTPARRGWATPRAFPRHWKSSAFRCGGSRPATRAHRCAHGGFFQV